MAKSSLPGRGSEESLQIAILEWIEEHRPDLMCVHIPNGAIRSHKERQRMLEQGMTPGMPDLLLIDAEGRHGYMEVKTDRGAISMTQWDIREELVRRQVPWALVRSCEDVEKTLGEWGWEAPTPPAKREPEAYPTWPKRLANLPLPLQNALTDLPWDEPQAVSTRFGETWVRTLAPPPPAFQELWKAHKAELKSVGITLKRGKRRVWQATWWFNRKAET